MHRKLVIENMRVSAAIFLVALALCGCAGPQGGESPVAAAGNGINDALSKVKEVLEGTQKAVAVKGPEGPRIKDTALANLFGKYPLDGTKPPPDTNGELWFPRVALIPVTVPSSHKRAFGDTTAYGEDRTRGARTFQLNAVKVEPANTCWTFRAKIWDSATKSRDIPDFLYCMDESMQYVRVGGPQPPSVFGRIFVSKTNSGSLFTTGPRQPQQVASRKFIDPAEVHLRSYGYWAAVGVMMAMGIDPFELREGNRVWFADADYRVKDF